MRIFIQVQSMKMKAKMKKSEWSVDVTCNMFFVADRFVEC